MDTSLDSIITVDETGRIIDFNPTAEKIFGYSAEIAIGQFIEPLIISSDSRRDFWNALHACLSISSETHIQARYEMRARHHDGHILPVEIAIKPLLIRDHFLFTVYLHDMSTRKQQEQEIRNLAAFPEESPMPVLRVNRRGVIIYANAPSRVLLNYWEMDFLQTLPLYWRNQIELVLNENIEKEYEVADGVRYYSLLLVPIREGDYVNIYGRDVTETRKAEAESRQHQTELVHVCRLSTMGEMATGIAHELNQPLAAITNYARGSMRRLRDNPQDIESILQAMEKISTQAYRAGEIIKRMRAMLGKQPAIRDQGDLNQLVAEVVSFVEFEARKAEVVIQQDLSTEAIAVMVDFVQIEQVVLNIVKNALDVLAESSVEEKRIVIETGLCRSHGGQVFISVSDNGPGIPEQIRLQLFHPFFTTKKTGMGMGLAISKTIIDDHNGQIEVSSQPGQGTCFIIRLPATGISVESGHGNLKTAGAALQ
jgi:two-component system sensor kinase FixL